MKKWIMSLSLIILFFSACNKNEVFWEDEEDPIIDTQSEQDLGSEEDGALTLYRVNGDAISKIKDYQVSRDLESYQMDVDKHFKMWDFVSRLLPAQYRDKISQFEVFYGGDELQGYVFPPNEEDLSQWRFGLAIEIAENLDQINFKDLFTYVTLHEYAHVLTLNDEQVEANASEGSCGTFFTGEGCSREGAYIQRLYDLGWKDLANDPDLEDPDRLYNKYPDRFVTDYAATNPGEDIAEVFSFFVTMENKPSGNKISDQKIRMLYDFPELVKMRQDIRQNEVIQLTQPGSWRQNQRLHSFKVCNRRGCK